MKDKAVNREISIKTFIIGVLLLAAGTASLFYWGAKKEVWFCDEIYTYESSNGFEQDWPMEQLDQWMTGKDVDAFFAADKDTLSLNDITVRLYNDHVPLYFWLFRMVSFFFFKGSGSIWIGLIINLLFYLVFLILCYNLFLQLTNSPIQAGAVLFLTCIVNCVMIEQITVLRMYMMLLLAEGMLLLGGLQVLRESGKSKLTPGLFLYLFAVSVTGFLTHYDYWIFYAAEAFVFCLWLLILAFKRNRKKFWISPEFRYVVAWTGNFIISLLTTIWLFPYCRWNLNKGKGQTALHSFFNFSDAKFGQIAWGYERISRALFGYAVPVAAGMMLIFGCIIGGMILLYRKKEYKKLAGFLLTVLTAQLYQLIVCFTMPAAMEERYLWGEFTIMALCTAWGAILLLQSCLSKIKKIKVRRISQWIIGIILSVYILTVQLSIIDFGKGVAYLFYEEKDMNLLVENRDIPWIVYGATDVYSCYDWRIPEKICFLSSDITAEDTAAIQKLQENESFVLYSYEDQLTTALTFFEDTLDRKLSAQYLTKSTNFNVYLIE